MPTAIHVSPHPDDESIAAPCTLLALQEAGWRIINFAVGYGRPGVRERRRGELRAALKIAGFEHRESSAAPGISRGDNLNDAYRTLVGELRTLAAQTRADLIIGPHPRDSHHGHYTVARAVRRVVQGSPTPLTWWMWSIWADLPRPTLIVDCTPKHLDVSTDMLMQYTGEISRNDFRAMHVPIRRVNAIRGIEKALGYGAAPGDRLRCVEHAELLTEVTVIGRRWKIGRTRLLDTMDIGTTWSDLDDLSILSSTRLRPAYRSIFLGRLAGLRVPFRPISVEPLPDHEAGG